MRKITVLFGAVMLGLLAFAGPAAAQYAPSPGVSNTVPEVGSSVTVNGNGCSGPVTVTIDGEVVGTGTASADGSFAVDIDVPTEPGEYLLEVSCGASGSAAPAGVAVAGELAGGVELAGDIGPCGIEPGTTSANSACILTVYAQGEAPGGGGGVDAGGASGASGGTVTAAGTLPRTGSDSSLPLAQVGVVLVALGGLAVLVTRKRSASDA